MTHQQTAGQRMPGQQMAGRHAVITGAGAGIGREAALLFAREGAAVAAADLNLAAAEATAEAITAAGGKSLALEVDVAKGESVSEMIAAAEAGLGRVDTLFNNAGIMLSEDRGPEDTDLAIWDRTIAINLTGVFHGCRFGIPALRRAGGGAILNMASLVAVMGSAVPQLAYTASKGGVMAMTREIAVQYGRQGIRANALLPGPIGTPLTAELFDTPQKLERRRVHMPLGRFGEAAEVASVACFLCSEAASYVTGAGWLVDGGISAAYVTPEDGVSGDDVSEGGA
ncbi:SDR family oxidoreductase [Pelagibius sp.]|uniref:SDR family oxidoreductase n=1 Tax=Pelagibius sp. TaxID=1931238 RepID=UPI003B50B226